LVSERKPTADQQLSAELDQLLAALGELQQQLTNAQQESMLTNLTEANEVISRFEVMCQRLLL